MTRYKCDICRKWFWPGASCNVAHPPGECCHAFEQPCIGDEVLSKKEARDLEEFFETLGRVKERKDEENKKPVETSGFVQADFMKELDDYILDTQLRGLVISEVNTWPKQPLSTKKLLSRLDLFAKTVANTLKANQKTNSIVSSQTLSKG